MRKILIRIDDVCPTMNRAMFDFAISKLIEHGCNALLGVVPDCKDKDLLIEEYDDLFWQKISELQKNGFTIAMHGYEHRFDINARGMVNNGNESEFAGHTYEEQFEKIKKGKSILQSHGIETDVFFAPAHSYDNNTLKALSANGFKYVSDGKSCKPYISYGVMSIPCRSGGISSMRFGRYQVAVIHTHEWTRPNKKTDKERFENLLKNHSNEIVSFEEFKKQGTGCLLWQKMTERLYVLYERKLKPTLTKYLKVIIK